MHSRGMLTYLIISLPVIKVSYVIKTGVICVLNKGHFIDSPKSQFYLHYIDFVTKHCKMFSAHLLRVCIQYGETHCAPYSYINNCSQ